MIYWRLSEMIIFRKMTTILFSFTLAFSINFSHAQNDVAVQDGKSLLKRCVYEGPSNVANGFSKKDWDELGEKVAAGDEEWVEASACLYHAFGFHREDYSIGKDAGEGDLGDYALQTLNEAWTELLLKDPKPLLELGDKISFSPICRYPMWIEKQPIEWVNDCLEKALTAINKVEDDGYTRSSKRECEFYLRLDRERVMINMIDALRR